VGNIIVSLGESHCERMKEWLSESCVRRLQRLADLRVTRTVISRHSSRGGGRNTRQVKREKKCATAPIAARHNRHFMAKVGVAGGGE
jgi:hypothetical protein